MAATAAWVTNNCPATLVWKRWSKSACVMVSSAPKCSTPALLTNRSRPPNSGTTASNNSWARAAPLASAGKADAECPVVGEFVGKRIGGGPTRAIVDRDPDPVGGEPPHD